MATATRRFEHEPDLVFAAITDVSQLPNWNRAVTKVLEEPGDLRPGSEWVVEMTALGRRWPSRSRVEHVDPSTRTFRYRSCTDDGNPSYAEWQWTVVPAAGGCDVTVEWKLVPNTFWRRILLSRIRARQLGRAEVPSSLAALDRWVRRE